jgi:hypothetical protein
MAYKSVFVVIFVCEECKKSFKIYVPAEGNNLESVREMSFDLVCPNLSGCTWLKSKHGREAFHISPTPVDVQTSGGR